MENTKAAGYAPLVFLSLISILVLPAVPFSEASANSEVKMSSSTSTGKQSYIVQMKRWMKPDHFSLHRDWYISLIDEVSGYNSEDPAAALLYTYDIIMDGFAAKLTSAEAEAMENMDGCLAVYPDSVGQLLTTRSPEFMGFRLSDGLWPLSDFGDDIIVGVVDTGVWPESKSFNDDGYTPVPARWKGVCEVGSELNTFHCNKKLIGARYFLKGSEAKYGPLNETMEYISPRDTDGHGTHASSIAAGVPVEGASLFGFASGRATGIAPNARLAVYKACGFRTESKCVESDVISAMQAAISDGVDVLSVSLGFGEDGEVVPYHSDMIAIGGLRAIDKGIFVSCAAGNSGPTPSSVYNTAPWLTTVGASSIDREFPAPVLLGNGNIYRGSSLYKGINTLGSKQLPLVYGRTASLSNGEDASVCKAYSLDRNTVYQNIVLCNIGTVSIDEKEWEVTRAGGAGMIVVNDRSRGQDLKTVSYFSFPATCVDFKSGEDIRAYIANTANPTAAIQADGLTKVGDVQAPVVAAFSSRGPNPVVPEILKPDLIAPGVYILAAWTGLDVVGPTRLTSDYQLVSGTSMACPHVAAIAALLRKLHPDWTPAAIKSALMTSAALLGVSARPIHDSATGLVANASAIGAGHVYPDAAMNPGLVYDAGFDDYISFLCSLEYPDDKISMMAGKQISCRDYLYQVVHLNYPSFSVVFDPLNLFVDSRRTLTNVGEAPSEYRLALESPPSVTITVEPTTLVFNQQKEKLSFTVRFESKIPVDNISRGLREYGHIQWIKCVSAGCSSGTTTTLVNSPVAIVWE